MKRCLKCRHTFAHSNAPGRDVVTRNGPAIRYSCPECHSEELEDFVACDDCQIKPPVRGDDYCATCRDLRDEREFWPDAEHHLEHVA